MNSAAVSIKTVEKKGVLHRITQVLCEKNYNITYTHLTVRDDYGHVYMEISNITSCEELINIISGMEEVLSVTLQNTSEENFGKRVIVIGDGPVMAQTLEAAIMEAEIHNRTGECISVDGMIINGGDQIQKAINSLDKLPRIHALVLAGDIMGGEIKDEITELKKRMNELRVISLKMVGDAGDVADLVVEDSKFAGCMAVKLVSDRNYYNNEILDNTFM